MTQTPSSPVPAPPSRPAHRRRLLLGAVVLLGTILATVLIVGLLVSIFTRKQEARQPFVRLVEVTEWTDDPAVWGQNWPRQYDDYLKTVDYERTRYGGSDAIPAQKLETDPWLKLMYSGYAFSLDYREARGHAYMLADQEATRRQEKPQPGACLHCHASVLNLYRTAGNGDVHAGFLKVNAMPYWEAHDLKGPEGERLVQHPVSCVDCHDPETMRLRVTRPGFIEGVKALKASQGVRDYDPNRDATRQEMRTFACAQCHVEYYFKGDQKLLTYPWHNGLKIENMERYYDDLGYRDYTHGVTGAPILKAQHPEFELYSQGIHARAGVACADCHMPYVREGAMKISDHHVRSPLLNINNACQTCHRVGESELLSRAEAIQERTAHLIDRAAAALVDMIEAIAQARAAGATDEQLAAARDFHRKAQWRLDFVSSENSRGFHADQETARILGEAIDYARRGQLAAQAIRAPVPADQPLPPPPPVRGVTPQENAPPGPERPGVNPEAEPAPAAAARGRG